MSKSWAHAVRLLTDAERDHHARWSCGTPRCEDRPTHATSYRYVTGRAGRVSDAERRVCPAHAERFAAKHGLTMPTAAAERPRGAMDVAMQDLLGAPPRPGTP